MAHKLALAILDNIDRFLLDSSESGQLSYDRQKEIALFTHQSLSGDLPVDEVLKRLEMIMIKFPLLVPPLVGLDIKKLCLDQSQ